MKWLSDIFKSKPTANDLYYPDLDIELAARARAEELYQDTDGPSYTQDDFITLDNADEYVHEDEEEPEPSVDPTEEALEQIGYETGDSTTEFLRQLVEHVNILNKKVNDLEDEVTTLKEEIAQSEFYKEAI